MKARIIKIISNQYTVLTENNERVLCVAMGKIRLQITPVVGDLVEIVRYDDQVGIEKILERKNTLVRPAIANVDQAIIVMSSKDPEFSTTLVDRISFLIQIANIQPILCITKMDLVDDHDELYQIIDDYRKSGYICLLCGRDNVDNELASILCDKITVLTGQSGVGKSTLLNTLDPTFKLRTQETSKALGRGKHTTRHSELHEVAGGWVADTPGFSSLDFTHTTPDELANSLFEFRPYIGKCKFRNCIHVNEPGCVVKEAVENGSLSKIRYDDYLQCLPLMKK
ncbi:ribosome small subunit-dependent GTPase A [Anaerorhabdus sp.]|uniref:ribosome small subunit-dependent GTPase A n=1 Tax=Anaerorhabdus sp. TaxID=1872524 RepID=UPI002FCBC1E6